MPGDGSKRPQGYSGRWLIRAATVASCIAPPSIAGTLGPCLEKGALQRSLYPFSRAAGSQNSVGQVLLAKGTARRWERRLPGPSGVSLDPVAASQRGHGCGSDFFLGFPRETCH